MAFTSPSINLLKKEKANFVDIALKWALSLGRFLVVITEFIALSAFAYRFGLDRQLIDLHDTIKQKQTIVQLLKNNEDQYRNLQERLAASKQLTNEQKISLNLYQDIINLSSQNVTINGFILSGEVTKIDASVGSLQALTTFVNGLKTHPHIASISLDKIENKTASAIITVSITAFLKK